MTKDVAASFKVIMNAFSTTAATSAAITTPSHRVFLMSHQDHAPCRRKLRVE